MSVGATLAEARQQAELTVAQLSERTRIRETIIEGIERDDFSGCGGDFYARGHIRALASYLGLEPEAMVRQYDEVHRGTRPNVRASAVFKVDGLIRNRGRGRPNWAMAITVVLALVVVFGIVRLLAGSGSAGETAAQLPVVRPNAAPHHAKAHQPGAGKGAADVVVLKVVARRPSYLNVRDGQGHRLFQGMLAEGESSTWTAKDRMRVTIGDAGAVRVEVNGKDLGVPGREGQTLRRTFEAGRPGPR